MGYKLFGWHEAEKNSIHTQTAAFTGRDVTGVNDMLVTRCCYLQYLTSAQHKLYLSPTETTDLTEIKHFILLTMTNSYFISHISTRTPSQSSQHKYYP